MVWVRELKSDGLEELCIKTGVRNTSRYAPVHDLADKTGRGLLSSFAHSANFPVDYTRQFGTKHAALKQS